MRPPSLLKIPLSNLRPIQGSLTYYAESLGNDDWVDPVETLLYESEIEDPDALFLLLDGHHRAYRAHLLGSVSILGQALSEDDHIAASDTSAIRDLTTVDQVKSRYRKLWLPMITRDGVTSIDTMDAVGIGPGLSLTEDPSADWFHAQSITVPRRNI